MVDIGTRVMVTVSPFKGRLGTVEGMEGDIFLLVRLDKKKTDSWDIFWMYLSQVDAFSEGDDKPAPNGYEFEGMMLTMLIEQDKREKNVLLTKEENKEDV